MADVKVFNVTEPYLDYECVLGEAIHYDATAHVLRFMDLGQQHLHTIDLNRGPSSHEIIKDLPVAPTKIVDVAGHPELLAAGCKRGYAIFPKANPKAAVCIDTFYTAAEIAEGQHEKLNSNDGGVDARGRFWLANMEPFSFTGMTPAGVLHRLDPDGRQQRMLSNITVPNGISFSLNNDTMYFTDSMTASVFAFDFAVDAGTISNKRVFFSMQGWEPFAAPDGNCIDAEGCLWTACFGNGKVLRLNPQGEVVAEVRLPTACITDCAFEGTGSRLWITTAQHMVGGTDEEKAESAKMQGRLFCVDVGVKGAPLHGFRWEAQDSHGEVPKL